MLNKIVRGLIAVVAAVATAMVTAPASHAGTRAAGLLLGQHQNLGGSVWYFPGSKADIGSAGDKASSAKNDDTVAWLLFDDKNFSDRRYCLAPGYYVKDLHFGSWNFGDKISSVKRLTTSSCSGHPTF
ncbi:hypothetical protein GTU99_10375 [Streptomyces sp. PRKS01-65]|nr:hypothetical protein [Streptomyces harenosi]NEY32592.1 hypothetical protein [Streptomyces harenosi]